MADPIDELNYYEGTDKIIEWAIQRGLVSRDNVPAQTIKLMEEMGEVAAGVAKQKPDLMIDGIGDVLVVMIILGENFRLRYPQYRIAEGEFLEYCLSRAWAEIKDRTGKTENGIFIKEADAQ